MNSVDGKGFPAITHLFLSFASCVNLVVSEKNQSGSFINGVVDELDFEIV